MTIGVYLGVAYIAAPAPVAVADQRNGYLGVALRATLGIGKGGHGRIEGIVTLAGSGAARRVRLYDDLTGMLVDQTWSADDGSYAFDDLDATRKYLVIAHDHTETYNAAVADTITPV